MKKVLIITYYWPPSGGAGVQRWLKFSKYLPEFGWQPIIYTPENPDFSIEDDSLAKDIPKETVVLKTKIWEPYSLYKKFSGQKEESANTGFFAGGKKTWKQRLSIFIRGNFFIPDPRVFWVKPSIKYLKKYLKENPVYAIVSTGPPHSMHLIALGLKKHFPNIKWIADFRDPWTEIDFYQDLNLTSWADNKHHKLEQEVINTCDVLVTVSHYMKKQFTKKTSTPVEVIYNGYDEDDFKDINNSISSDKFVITYVGSMNKDRNHEAFWKAIKQIIESNSELKEKLSIKLIGNMDASVELSIHKNGLENYVEVVEYLPHHEALEEMSKASLLYLSINNVPSAKGIMTGKVFEYLAIKKPIICVGPEDGEISKMEGIRYAKFGDTSTIERIIFDTFNGEISSSSFSSEEYSRKKLTVQFVHLLGK